MNPAKTRPKKNKKPAYWSLVPQNTKMNKKPKSNKKHRKILKVD